MAGDTLPTRRIKYKGIFDYAGLQKNIFAWQQRRGFSVHEKLYHRKPSNEIGKEEQIKYASWRKETPFIKYWVNIYIHTWDIQPVEVVKGGVKKDLTKARILIEFHGLLEWDYGGMFGKTWFTEKLLKFYTRYIRGAGTDKEWDAIWNDRGFYYILKLMTEVKEFLQMETANNDAYATMW